MIKKALFIVALFASTFSFAQLSVSSDISAIRQLGEHNSFWGLAQNVRVSYPFSNKTSGYLSIGYSTPGKSSSASTTQAYSPQVYPQTINYTSRTSRGIRQFTIGLKQYLSGTHNMTSGTGVYVVGGVGIASVKAQTETSTEIDTSTYRVNYPFPGSGSDEKFSIELGAGIERPIGGNFFWYAEAKGWLPQSQFTSVYLPKAERVHGVMVGVGLRVLFGYY